MEKINSLNNPLIKNLLKLQNKKYRNLSKMFLIEGFHLVQEAMTANCLEMVITSDESNFVNEARNVLVSDEIIKKLSTTQSPQKILGVCRYINYNYIKANRYLLLDNIQDPGNLGTLIRSSLGFNVDLIILGNDCVDVYNEKTIRSTQGAIFKIPFISMNLIDAIKILKKDQIKVFGTSLNGLDLKTIERPEKYALILGNEGNGIKKEILAITDDNIRIKMNEKLESLNVSIAGSIILYNFS